MFLNCHTNLCVHVSSFSHSVGDDYDYKYLKHHNFGNSGDPSRERVMSEESMTRGSSAKTSQSKLGLSQMGESIFSDDASFEEQYNESEEILPFEITVPAGKLGMVIDTPNGGFPIVHAIKDTSILADRVRVGDRLVSVDGQDCTTMSALQVSKLISLKSGQTARVLVFVRNRIRRPLPGE
jgi:C-terminal processing protease CtpA/Prc